MYLSFFFFKIWIFFHLFVPLCPKIKPIIIKMKRICLVLWVLLCMTALSVNAAPRTQAQMREAAAKAINGERAIKKMALRRASDLNILKNTAEYQIIGMEQGGFAVVAADDRVPEVLGVSTSKYSDGHNENFKWWLEAVGVAVKYAIDHDITLTTTKPDPNKYPSQVGPLMTTLWDQLEPYNRLCPISNGGDRCYTGCVATAMAQVLNYFKVPYAASVHVQSIIHRIISPALP